MATTTSVDRAPATRGISRRVVAGLLAVLPLHFASASAAKPDPQRHSFLTRRRRAGQAPMAVRVLPSTDCHVCDQGCRYPTIQAAVSDGDGPETILICAGTYTELMTLDRDVTLAGTGAGTDGQSTILQGPGYGSVLTIAAGRTATLKDLRITGGAAEFGGGITSEGDLTLTNVTVYGNAARFGGGIFSRNGTVTGTASTFSGNEAADSGGGLYTLDSTCTLTGCLLTSNVASYGGAIHHKGSGAAPVRLSLGSTTISGNSASNKGGGIFLDGPCLVELTENEMHSNIADIAGDEVFNTAPGCR